MKTILTARQVADMGYELGGVIRTQFESKHPLEQILIYPIPRGGIPAAYSLLSAGSRLAITDDPTAADCFVDDIIDSGSTMEEWSDNYPGKPFYALIDKTDSTCIYKNDWIIFPWENQDESDASDDSIVSTITNRIQRAGKPFFANDNISDFIKSPLELEQLQLELRGRVEKVLRGLIIDVDNDHSTADTADRVAKMYLTEIFKGRYEPAPSITSFPNTKNLDEVYITGPITIRSHCSHHFLPVSGKCWIGVVPGSNVIGLSKFNRIADWVASRPQMQEEMTIQIADYLENEIQPIGIAVVIKASHGCMTCRGVKEPGDAAMATSVMRGVFREKPEARAEFFSLIEL